MQHLLNIEDFSEQDFYALVEIIDCIESDALCGVTIATLFCEPSTRSRVGYTIAAQKLGANVIDIKQDHSSLVKGETVADTALALSAMGVNGIVIRHSEQGLSGRVAHIVGNAIKVINAGDGCHQHPTQALIDCYTILKHKGGFAGLSVLIVGDFLHSRVARSEVALLSILGVKDIRLVMPEFLKIAKPLPNTRIYKSLDDALSGVDVVITLRNKVEKMNHSMIMQNEKHRGDLVITSKNLANAAKDVILMNPGPMSFRDEISSELLSDSRCLVLEQIRNGMQVRSAILAKMFHVKHC